MVLALIVAWGAWHLLAADRAPRVDAPPPASAEPTGAPSALQDAVRIEGGRDERPVAGGDDADSAAQPGPEATARPRAHSRLSEPLQIQLNGLVVDEHDQPLEVERLRERVAGELPRVWLVHRGQRVMEFLWLSEGLLRGALVPPAEPDGLRAELVVAGRRFDVPVELDREARFTLRVDLASLGAESSALTVVVRPNPQAVAPTDKWVVLRRSGTRRAAALDRDGIARFATLAPGVWRGVVVVDGELPAEFTVQLGEREDREQLVELQQGFRITGFVEWDGLEEPLPPGGVLATRARPPFAGPLDDGAIEVLPDPVCGSFARLGGDGSYALGPLTEGEWRLQVVRLDGIGAATALAERRVVLGGRDVERVDLLVPVAGPPARTLRLLMTGPGGVPRDVLGNFAIPRMLVASFFGAEGEVLSSTFVDGRPTVAPVVPLPAGAVRLELVWREQAGGLLLDCGLPVTRVALPRVVQEGKTEDLRVELAADPRD